MRAERQWAGKERERGCLEQGERAGVADVARGAFIWQPPGHDK